MFNSLDDAGIFLVQTVFDLYIFVVLLRVMLQWAGADFFNPISQFVVKMTNPLLLPLRRIIPSYKKVDTAALLLVFVLEMLKLTLVVLLQAGIFPNLLGLMVWSLGTLLHQLLDILFYAIVGVVILSWVSPMAHSPIVEILYRLTEPVLAPIRRMLPPVSGFDLSPILALILLKALEILLVKPILKIGIGLIAAG